MPVLFLLFSLFIPKILLENDIQFCFKFTSETSFYSCGGRADLPRQHLVETYLEHKTLSVLLNMKQLGFFL